MKKNKTLLVIAALTAVVSALAATIAAPAAQSRAQNTVCTATGAGLIPQGAFTTATWSVGAGGCPNDPWKGTADIRNSSGVSAISGYPESISGTSTENWSETGLYCSGKTIHPFEYVNDGGHGSSYTGSSITCS